jgi:tetratricopeptide (TPR) repeat protein
VDTQLWNDDAGRWTLPAAGNPFAEATFDYTNALAAIRRGDLKSAREAASRVDSEMQHAVAWIEQRKMDSSQARDSAVIYNGELHALLAAVEGKTEEAIAELQRMAAKEHQMPMEFGPPGIEKPTDELLGELLLQLHRPAEAKDAFQEALARTPGRRSVVEALARTEKDVSTSAAAKPNEKQPSSNSAVHKH